MRRNDESERIEEISSEDEGLRALIASIMRANAYAESIGMNMRNVEDNDNDDNDPKND